MPVRSTPLRQNSIPEGASIDGDDGMRTRAQAEQKYRQPLSPVSPYDGPALSPTSPSPTPLYSTSKGSSNNFMFPDKRSPTRSNPTLHLTPHNQALLPTDRQQLGNNASRPMTADKTRTQVPPARAPRRSVPSGSSSGSALPRVTVDTKPAFPDLSDPARAAPEATRQASSDGQWLMASRPLSSQAPSRPLSSQVGPKDKAPCRHAAAQAMVLERDKDSLALEWNQMMCGLDGLDITGDTDAYTLACAILLVKEGIYNYQENAPATACHCCNRAHHRDPLINVMLLDGLMGGAMTRLRQRGRTASVPVDIDFHTINDTDRLIMMTNIYGVTGKGAIQKQRYVRPRPPPTVQTGQAGVQTDALWSETSGVQTDVVGAEESGTQAELDPRPELADACCQTDEPAEPEVQVMESVKKCGYELLLDSFSGADLGRLEAFAGAAAQSLGALMELAAGMKTDLGATAAQAAALSLASATMAPEAALADVGGADAAGKLTDVTAALAACLEVTSSQLEGARLVAGGPEAGAEAAGDAEAAPQGLVDALNALTALQEQLSGLGAKGGEVELVATEPDTSMAESGLPSLVPLLQQLQLAGTQLVHSFAVAVSACLGAAGPQGGETEAAAFTQALGDASAAAAAVQRLLRVLADEGHMAQGILTHRPRKAGSSPALDLITDFTSAAESRYSAVLEWVSPALQAMQALADAWAAAGAGDADQAAGSMALVQQLLGSLGAWNQDLVRGLEQELELQERGAGPLGLQEALTGSGAVDAAAASAANLGSLAAAVEGLYAVDPGAEPADKAVHASALLPLVQGQLVNAGALLDAWIGSCHKAWDVTRAHALHEALQGNGLPSYVELAQENEQLAEKLKEAEAQVKALEEQLAAAVQQAEEAQAKAEAAEAALADLFGPGKGMTPEEAEAARRQISELQEELAGKAAALEAAEKSLEELKASLEEATKQLEEMTAKVAALEAAGAKLEEMEAKLQEVEEKLKEAEEKLLKAEKQLQEAGEKVQEAEQKLAAGEGKLEESKKKLEGSEKNVADLTAKDAAHLQEIDALKKRIQELEEALKQALVKPEPPVVEKGCFGC